MKASSSAVAVLGFLLAVGCSTNQKEYGQLENTADDKKLYISFNVTNADYQRTVSQINRTATGWVEYGTWHASSNVGVSEVKIYLATLFDGRVFPNKSVKEMRERARQFAPAGSLDFGDQGELNTNSGPVEYVFYRTVARACVFIRKYWSDPDTQGDVNRGNSLFAWVAGTSVIYATYCKPGAEDLQFIEINLLFNGIKARNLYWPNNMFASD